MQTELFGFFKTAKQASKQAPKTTPVQSSSCFGKDRIVKLSGDEIFFTPKQLADKIGFHLQSVYAWKRLRGMPVRQATNHGRWTVEWHEFCKWWKESKA